MPSKIPKSRPSSSKATSSQVSRWCLNCGRRLSPRGRLDRCSCYKTSISTPKTGNRHAYDLCGKIRLALENELVTLTEISGTRPNFSETPPGCLVLTMSETSSDAQFDFLEVTSAGNGQRDTSSKRKPAGLRLLGRVRVSSSRKGGWKGMSSPTSSTPPTGGNGLSGV